MISCLCVTRGDRLAMLAEAVNDFARQCFAARELVILHDADDAAHDAMAALAGLHPSCAIRVVRVAAQPRLTLGALRNAAVAAARGTWVCQWDDDDRCHPERLALQHAEALRQGAAACYLVDQLHWFVADGRLCWDDWGVEPYPMDVIQGTILARRDAMPPYPDLARGEDTLHTAALMRAEAQAGRPVARLRGAGWCTIYRQHAANVWDKGHHAAISAWKHLPPARLLPRLRVLNARMAEYDPPIPELRMPLGAGTVAVGDPRAGSAR